MTFGRTLGESKIRMIEEPKEVNPLDLKSFGCVANTYSINNNDRPELVKKLLLYQKHSEKYIDSIDYRKISPLVKLEEDKNTIKLIVDTFVYSNGNRSVAPQVIAMISEGESSLEFMINQVEALVPVKELHEIGQYFKAN